MRFRDITEGKLKNLAVSVLEASVEGFAQVFAGFFRVFQLGKNVFLEIPLSRVLFVPVGYVFHVIPLLPRSYFCDLPYIAEP